MTIYSITKKKLDSIVQVSVCNGCRDKNIELCLTLETTKNAQNLITDHGCLKQATRTLKPAKNC